MDTYAFSTHSLRLEKGEIALFKTVLNDILKDDTMYSIRFDEFRYVVLDGRIYARGICQRNNNKCELVHVARYERVTKADVIAMLRYSDCTIEQMGLFENVTDLEGF